MSAKSKKILVIEDETTIRTMYETSIKNNGYDVVSAANGEEGLEKAKAEKPDVILLDVMMPKLDGWQTLEELKKEADTKKIPVIMLTNLGQDEDRARGEKLGAADYWIKADLTPLQINEKLKKYF